MIIISLYKAHFQADIAILLKTFQIMPEDFQFEVNPTQYKI